MYVMSEIHMFFTLIKCIILRLHNAKSIRKKDFCKKKTLFVENKHLSVIY